MHGTGLEMLPPAAWLTGQLGSTGTYGRDSHLLSPRPVCGMAEEASHQHRKGKSSDQIVYGILWSQEPRIAQLIQRKL